MDVCRHAGLRIALNCYLKTGRGRKYPIHDEENQVYIMLNVLNCGVKFMLRMNGNILIMRCILRTLQIIGTTNQ